MSYQVMDTTNGDIVSTIFDERKDAEKFLESRSMDYNYCEIAEIND